MRFSARGLFMGNRGGRFHTDAKTLTTCRRARGNGSAACSTLRADDARSGAVPTPSCSFLTSQPRLPLGTGPASNAGARTRGLCRKMGRSAPVSRATIRGGDGQRAARGTLTRRFQKPAQAQHRRVARRRIHRIRWSGLRRSCDTLLHWTPDGYHAREPRPRRIAVGALVPPVIIGILSAGYEPRWHPSATD